MEWKKLKVQKGEWRNHNVQKLVNNIHHPTK
ncbi:uncharacterized protein G2W53_008869 [Senna tora]|uniref:Uncharacterized protein n=1 Tax=Senna tora TaxID=362788 RepID=A0A834WX85_9FABA|nr:uncharacterized protein G2W53_008869 [Senna tora]